MLQQMRVNITYINKIQSIKGTHQFFTNMKVYICTVREYRLLTLICIRSLFNLGLNGGKLKFTRMQLIVDVS